jgi:hypothetical protein
MSFYTYRGKPRLYSGWICEEIFFQIQRRRGERMSSFNLYRYRGDNVPRMVTGWICKERGTNPAKKGERICVEIFIKITPPILALC